MILLLDLLDLLAPIQLGGMGEFVASAGVQNCSAIFEKELL